MSGSKEELPTAPDETVEPQTAVEPEVEKTGAEETRAEEAAAERPAAAGDTREAPATGDEAQVEMTAAEALAQATLAAAGNKRNAVADGAPSEALAQPAAPEEAQSTELDEEPAAEAASAETEPVTPAESAATEAAPAESTAAEPKVAEPAAAPPPDRPELRAIREAIANRDSLEGRVIGWNNGGFHLALGELSAFCPRSEMELGEIHEPETYLDQSFLFRVLRLQGKGRRIVVSRAAHLRNEQSRQRSVLRKKLQVGAVLEGTVASLKDFGAFVELGGSQGLVHVSEISHRRVEHPSDVLSEGQQVQVKVLKVEQGGRRISLSLRALEPDPWKDLADRFPRGAVVKGKVEKANQIGAFIELAPGLTGLLPAKSLPIPRETTPARAYPPGKEVSVQIVSVDPRRQRIALALEGSGLEGSRNDYKEYQRESRTAGDGEGFNALASAFRRLRGDDD